VSRAPHSLQNLPVELGCAQEPQISSVAVSPPRPSRLAPTSLIVSPLVSDVWDIGAIVNTTFDTLCSCRRTPFLP